MDLRAKLATLALLLALIVGAYALRSVPWTYPLLVWLLTSCAAAIWIEDETHRPSLIAHLTAPTYTNLYHRLTARPANWPRDHRLYDWSLRLAVLYPILLPLLGWAVTGNATGIGDLTEGGSGQELFPAEPRLWPRVMTICAIALAIAAPALKKWASASPKPVLQQVSGWLPLLAFAFAFAFACAVAVAGAVALAGAFAVGAAVGAAGAFAFAGAFAGAFASAFAVSGGFVVAFIIAAAVAVAFAVERLANKGHPCSAYAGLTFVLFLVLAVALALLDWSTLSGNRRVVFLFIGLLPLLNAVFDYLSYLITLTLLRRGREVPEFAVWAGVVDLIAALFLFTLSGTAMIAAIAAAHTLSGVQLFPLAPLFQGIHDTPGQYWWLYAMLFSTIAPTVLHAIVALAAVPAATPLHWRQRFAGWAVQTGAVPAIAAPLAIGAVWVLSALVVCAIPTLFAVIARNIWPQIGAWYLGWFEWVARVLGELPPL